MLYLQWYLTNFQKLFFAERRGRWLLWLRISNAQTFSFSNSNVTAFPTSWKCKNFNFSLYTVPAEMLYLQRYLTNFQKLFFRLKEEEGGYWRWKFQVHRHFRFPIATLQLFQHPENVKISIFPCYTVPAEMLYFQKYLTNFQKLFFTLKEEEGGYCGWKSQVHRHFGFAIATLQLFQSSRKCKNFNFSFTLSRQKCYISRSI